MNVELTCTSCYLSLYCRHGKQYPRALAKCLAYRPFDGIKLPKLWLVSVASSDDDYIIHANDEKGAAEYMEAQGEKVVSVRPYFNLPIPDPDKPKLCECGGEAVVEDDSVWCSYEQENTVLYNVECKKCGRRSLYTLSGEDAIRIWNAGLFASATKRKL